MVLLYQNIHKFARLHAPPPIFHPDREKMARTKRNGKHGESLSRKTGKTGGQVNYFFLKNNLPDPIVFIVFLEKSPSGCRRLLNTRGGELFNADGLINIIDSGIIKKLGNQ
jgi:hypothetical protein